MFIGPPGADSTRWHKLGVHIVFQIVKYIGLLSCVSSTSSARVRVCAPGREIGDARREPEGRRAKENEFTGIYFLDARGDEARRAPPAPRGRQEL